MRKNKYGVAAKKDRTYNGIVYDSKAEVLRAAEHALLIRADKLTYVLRQVKFQLGPDFSWRADFVCFRNTPAFDGDYSQHLVWVEEIKGVETAKFRDVRRLWKKYGPFPMLIYKRKGTGWKVERLEGAQHA